MSTTVADLPQAIAQGDRDHDLARDLRLRGEIHSLSDILPLVHQAVPGDIIAVNLVHVGSTWIYRFQIVGDDGHLASLEVDARAATIIPAKSGDQ